LILWVDFAKEEEMWSEIYGLILWVRLKFQWR